MKMSGRGIRMAHQGYFLRVPIRGVHDLTSYITRESDLFLLAHMGLATIDAGQWTLEGGGRVTRTASFTLADILGMPRRDVTSVHECAGSPLTPTIPKRRVGNVVWRGVPLVHVLEYCGLQSGAAYVWAHGLESGEFAGLTDEPYVKDLPPAKATASDKS